MATHLLHLSQELTKINETYGEQGRTLLKTFAEEGHEICNRIELILLADDHDHDGLMRNIHTLKGSASQAGLSSLGKMLHQTESLLAPLAKNKGLIFDGLSAQLVNFFASFDELFVLLTRMDLNPGPSLPAYEQCSQVKNQIELVFSAISRDMKKAQENPELFSKETILATKGNGPLHPVEGESYRLQKSALDDILMWLEKILIELFRRRQDPSLSQSIRTLQDTLLTLVRARTDSAQELGEKLKRLTKDTAEALQKTVVVELSGFRTRLDSRLLGSLSEALLHLVRNAIDHGIESSQDRINRGKSSEATLKISIETKADRTLLIISDDGRGIDPEVVAKKALAKGLVSLQDVNRFNAYEKQELIFLPGFSTKDEISEVSGRGVGMDAVRSAVEKAKGKITVDSQAGQGTTFILTFPSSYIYEPMRILRYSSGLYAISERYVVRCITAEQWSFESGACMLAGGTDIYPLLALPAIDTHFNQEGGRPLILLSFGGAIFGLCCSEVLPEPREIFMVPATTQSDADLPAYIKGGCLEDDLGILQGLDLVEIELSINRYQFGAVQENLGGISNISALRGGAGPIADRLEADRVVQAEKREGSIHFRLQERHANLLESERQLLFGLASDCDELLARGNLQEMEAMAEDLSSLLQDTKNAGLSPSGVQALRDLSLQFLEFIPLAA